MRLLINWTIRPKEISALIIFLSARRCSHESKTDNMRGEKKEALYYLSYIFCFANAFREWIFSRSFFCREIAIAASERSVNILSEYITVLLADDALATTFTAYPTRLLACAFPFSRPRAMLFRNVRRKLKLITDNLRKKIIKIIAVLLHHLIHYKV